MSCTVCSSTYRAMPRLTSRMAALIEVQESPWSMETTFTPRFDILGVLPSVGSVRVGPMGESEGAQGRAGADSIALSVCLGVRIGAIPLFVGGNALEGSPASDSRWSTPRSLH